MAKRPVFVPVESGGALVKEMITDFEWFPGFSLQQKRKSIVSLHKAARHRGIEPLLEISTKSTSELGRALSAFNLQLRAGSDRHVSVEAAYQGGKVFELGGPYLDLYGLSGRKIKADARLRNSGSLIAFEFRGERWLLEPKTAFYNWLYVNALAQNPSLSDRLSKFRGFSDIEFNPKKSINCQARAAALFVALQRRNLLSTALSSQEAFIHIVDDRKASQGYVQSTLSF